MALGMPRRAFKDRRLLAAQDFAARALPTLDDRWQLHIADKAIAAECDVVISVWGDLMPAAVNRMREAGITVALWFPDPISNLGRQIMFVSAYSRVYLKDPLLVERVGTITGASVAYLPEACNPHWHRSTAVAGTTGKVVVVGNIYQTRALLLDRLVNDDVLLDVYGADPPVWLGERPWTAMHHHRSVLRQEKADVFRGAAGVLNNLHPSELSSVNCRLFEAASSGGAVLCEERSTLHDLFDVGVEVLSFSTYDELLKLARELIADPTMTARIGDAAATRAHAEHTYPHRLRTILEDCG